MSSERTRGLILAAGRGRRLQPLTDTRPKCLVTLAGRALLDWQLAALQASGIREVAVVVGYRGGQVRRPGVTRFENSHWADSNMVASLLCAREWLGSAPCVVSYADIVYHPDVVVRLCRSPQEIAIAYDVAWRSLWEARFDHPEGDAESLRVDGGLVVEIGRRVGDLGAVQGQYLGLVKFGPAGWRRTERWLSRLDDDTLRGLEMTHLLQSLISEGEAVAGIPIHGRWCEIDCVHDLGLYEAKIQSVAAWAHDWRFAAPPLEP